MIVISAQSNDGDDDGNFLYSAFYESLKVLHITMKGLFLGCA
jgi:hypothetical protein